jgi:hypothetical protein
LARGIIRKDEYELLKDKLNENIDHLRLSFSADDIKYIIVKKESEINPILNKIADIKGPIQSPEIVERLKSRVITSEQILSDNTSIMKKIEAFAWITFAIGLLGFLFIK